MGIFSRIKESIREMNERAAAERAAHYERMKPFMRGYDVYPQEVCNYFAGRVRSKLIRGLLIKSLLCAGAAALIAWSIVTATYAVTFIAGFVFLILFLLAASNLSQLLRMAAGNYDAFGAMVTNTFVETRTSTDSEGNSTTDYTYYVWLNGIKCEVGSSEFNKVSCEEYCYFVRLKGKYIRNDSFYFFPSDVSEQDHRIGQHYPEDELRLYRPPRGNGFAVLLLVLGIMAVIGGGIAMAVWSYESRHKIWIFIMICGGAAAVFGEIFRRISVSIRTQKAIEMKRRANDRK